MHHHFVHAIFVSTKHTRFGAFYFDGFFSATSHVKCIGRDHQHVRPARTQPTCVHMHNIARVHTAHTSMCTTERSFSQRRCACTPSQARSGPSNAKFLVRMRARVHDRACVRSRARAHNRRALARSNGRPAIVVVISSAQFASTFRPVRIAARNRGLLSNDDDDDSPPSVCQPASFSRVCVRA